MCSIRKSGSWWSIRCFGTLSVLCRRFTSLLFLSRSIRFFFSRYFFFFKSIFFRIEFWFYETDCVLVYMITTSSRVYCMCVHALYSAVSIEQENFKKKKHTSWICARLNKPITSNNSWTIFHLSKRPNKLSSHIFIDATIRKISFAQIINTNNWFLHVFFSSFPFILHSLPCWTELT